MNKLISVVIVTYKSEKDIFDCLESIYHYNDIDHQLEVIIVDNNSPFFDSTKERIQQQYPDVKILINSQNGGYGQGNNVGIRVASAPIVLIMNPDVRLIMPVFGKIHQTLSNDKVIMCGGKQYCSSTKPAISFYYDFTESGFLQSIGHIIARRTDSYNYKRMWLSGAFFAIKKDIFEQIGLFDENIFMYGEEFDIHLRLKQTFPDKIGVYLPHIKYIHLIENRIATEEQKQRQVASNVYIFQKNHLDIDAMTRNMNHTKTILKCLHVIVSIFRR